MLYKLNTSKLQLDIIKSWIYIETFNTVREFVQHLHCLQSCKLCVESGVRDACDRALSHISVISSFSAKTAYDYEIRFLVRKWHIGCRVSASPQHNSEASSVFNKVKKEQDE